MYVALPFWVYGLTGSATATGIMFAALTIPQLVLSPIAGVFVDRWNRKMTMIVSDLLRAGIVLGYFFVSSPDQVWIIYLLAFAESCVSRFFQPAVMAVTPTIVEGEQLGQANAALGASMGLAQLAGPALGGVLVAAAGPHGAAAFDALTYLVSAVLIYLMRIPRGERGIKAAPAGKSSEELLSIWRELKSGVRVVLARPVLRVVFASLGVLMLSQGIINVLVVVIVKQLWGGGAAELGWLISAQGVGAVIGTVVVGAIAARVTPRALAVFGGAISGVLLIAMVNQASLVVALGLLGIVGICVVAFDVGLTTLLQQGSDDENRGRVSSLMVSLMAAAQLLSIAATAILADRIGAVPLLDLAGIFTLIGGLIALLVPSGKAERAAGAASQTVSQPAD